MRKFLKWFAIFIVFVFVYGVYESTNKPKLSEDNNDQVDNKEEKQNVNVFNKKDSTSSFRLTEKEATIIKALLNEDFSTFLDGGESQFKYDYVVTTAKKIFSVYDKNQVKGDTSFKGKGVIISGIVGTINSGIGDIPYVVLKAGDMFDGVHISFKKDYRTLAGDLNKGQKVTYACTGDSVIVGTPTLKNCQPVQVVKNVIVENEFKKISDSMESKKPNKNTMTVYGMSAYMAILNEVNNNKCKDTDVGCLIKLINAKGNKPEDIDKTHNLSEEQREKLKNIKSLLKEIKRD